MRPPSAAHVWTADVEKTMRRRQKKKIESNKTQKCFSLIVQLVSRNLEMARFFNVRCLGGETSAGSSFIFYSNGSANTQAKIMT
jgi:hypothetical protein